MGWVVPGGGDTILLCLASSASEDSKEQNNFTEALALWLRRNAPQHVYTVPFSQLGRRAKFLEKIKAVIADNKILFSCTERPTMSLSDHPEDGVLWDTMAHLAEGEWVGTLERNFAGMIYSVKNGRLPKGQGVLPPGVP